jgi:hypothetical protein
MKEIWKPVPVQKYSDRYSVSNHGRVRREEYTVTVTKSNGTTYDLTYGQKQMVRHNCNGYEVVNLARDGGHSTIYVHRLVLKAFGGSPLTPDHEVNHIDGDKTNNHISNLEWMTKSENVKHAWKTGLNKRWEGKGTEKVSDADVRQIRRLYHSADDITYREIAEQYDLNKFYVNQIVNKKCRV